MILEILNVKCLDYLRIKYFYIHKVISISLFKIYHTKIMFLLISFSLKNLQNYIFVIANQIFLYSQRN